MPSGHWLAHHSRADTASSSIAAAALVPERGLTEERAWLRRTLNQEFVALSTAVSRMLSQHPGLKRAADADRDEVLTDSVAVRLYLSPAGSAIDAEASRRAETHPFTAVVNTAGPPDPRLLDDLLTRLR